jgi:hypothetical protein
MRVTWRQAVGFLGTLGVASALAVGCGAASSVNGQAQTDPSSVSSSSAGAAATTSRPSARHSPKPWYRRGMRTAGFQSPTGNIRCALQRDDDTQLLCKTLNNQNAVDLDTLLDADTYITATIPAEPTLRYGHGWSSANFYCWSESTGVTCRSLYSRHGVEVNRDGITALIWKAPVLAASGGLGGDSSSSIGGSGDDFCSTHTCIADFEDGTGYTVQCADGTWSQSGGKPGACSWHGGEAGG